MDIDQSHAIDAELLCLVGLGNPGDAYRATRHNIGFRVVDCVATRLRCPEFLFHLNHLRTTGTWSDRNLLLCKPWTYMNLSGNAVSLVVDEHQIDVHNLLVICDDAALPLGTLRLRGKGGSGGQNGLASIIEAIGTQEFPRLRCGIGVPGIPDMSDYVLSSFLDEERDTAARMVERACDAALSFVARGIDRTMTEFNISITN